MTDKERLEAEKNELNLLIQKGVNISVSRKVRTVTRRGLLGFFRRYREETETLTYTIKEPTLAVLDLLSAQQIDLIIDESKVSERGLGEAKQYARKYGRKMALILAIAVLGEDYFNTSTKDLDELTEVFFRWVKPSDLFQYVLLVNAMSNLGDFMNSIRLMSAVRTTMPIRIEANSGD